MKTLDELMKNRDERFLTGRMIKVGVVSKPRRQSKRLLIVANDIDYLLKTVDISRFPLAFKEEKDGSRDIYLTSKSKVNK